MQKFRTTRDVEGLPTPPVATFGLCNPQSSTIMGICLRERPHVSAGYVPLDEAVGAKNSASVSSERSVVFTACQCTEEA